MFKFYTKGDNNNLEAAVFYNGQKMLTVYCYKNNDEFLIDVYDGADFTRVNWVDFEESD